jgi:hypothetical protein
MFRQMLKILSVIPEAGNILVLDFLEELSSSSCNYFSLFIPIVMNGTHISSKPVAVNNSCVITEALTGGTAKCVLHRF